MGIALQVTCIKRDKSSLGSNFYPRISQIGGISNGQTWMHTTQEAIDNIRNGRNSYFVKINSTIAEVEVVTHNGIEYLRTNKDCLLTDNLSSLPECQ